MGAGAVGGYFGARLAAAGHEVHFVARGDHLAALRRQGLRVTSPLGDLEMPTVPATDDPAAIGPVEGVLFTVKSQDTESAATRIKPLLDEETFVVSLQNGIHNERVLAEVVGEARVLSGVAYIEAVIAEPGCIEHRSPFAKLVVGEPSAQASERAKTFVHLCENAGIDASSSDSIESVLWTKWLFICAFSGVTALTRKSIGAVLDDPDTTELYRRAMQEVADLAEAEGVDLPEGIVEERLEFSHKQLKPEMRSSLQGDLERGKPLELDALNGYVHRLGRELEVPTPVNSFIYAALKLHKEGTEGA